MMTTSIPRFPILLSLLVVFTIAAPGTAADRDEIYDTKADGRVQIDEAVAKAKKEGKRVLITWGANWCGWCHHLKDQMAGNDRIAALLEDAYVAIKIDLGDRDKHMDLARDYDLEFDDLGIPHITILDADGEVVANINGGDLGKEVGEDKGFGESGWEYPADDILAFLEKNRPERDDS